MIDSTPATEEYIEYVEQLIRWEDNDLAWVDVDKLAEYRSRRKPVLARIAAISDFTVRVEDYMDTQGLGTFDDFFLFSPGDDYRSDAQTGLRVYIHHLFPIAAYGVGSSDFFRSLNSDRIGTLPSKEWTELEYWLRALFETAKIDLPAPDMLRQPLPESMKVPTILADPPFTIFDGLFFWED